MIFICFSCYVSMNGVSLLLVLLIYLGGGVLFIYLLAHSTYDGYANCTCYVCLWYLEYSNEPVLCLLPELAYYGGGPNMTLGVFM
jgi:hypothetical protein